MGRLDMRRVGGFCWFSRDRPVATRHLALTQTLINDSFAWILPANAASQKKQRIRPRAHGTRANWCFNASLRFCGSRYRFRLAQMAAA